VAKKPSFPLGEKSIAHALPTPKKYHDVNSLISSQAMSNNKNYNDLAVTLFTDVSIDLLPTTSLSHKPYAAGYLGYLCLSDYPITLLFSSLVYKTR
jgi:hypothetical protein